MIFRVQNCTLYVDSPTRTQAHIETFIYLALPKLKYSCSNRCYKTIHLILSFSFLILVRYNPFKHFLQLFTFNKVVSPNINQISGFAMGKIFSDALEYLMAGGYFYCGCLSWCVCLYLGRRLSLACCHMMKEILPCFKKFCCLW